jgi:alpha,alpha-trehalose phosphorylase
MLTRPLHLPPEHLYPTDEWRVRETRDSDRYFPRAETAFSLSNGYVGIRGAFDEGRPTLSPGTFVNGFHETWRIVHAEDAYGLARTGQTIINVPYATVLRLFVDDEPLFIPTARLRHYDRMLDMREGTLSRELEWSTPSGKHVQVRSCRLVSFEHRHLVAIEYEVVLLDRAAPIVICCPWSTRRTVTRSRPSGTARRSTHARPPASVIACSTPRSPRPTASGCCWDTARPTAG